MLTAEGEPFHDSRRIENFKDTNFLAGRRYLFIAFSDRGNERPRTVVDGLQKRTGGEPSKKKKQTKME